MGRQPRTLQDWRKYHYEVEKDYASRIVLSPKGSEERKKLIEEAYSRVIGDIIERYDPEGGETHYTKVVVSIVHRLVPEGGSVFDLGCGSGNLISTLIRRGYEAKGIDISRDCIRRARERLRPLSSENCVEQADILDYETEDSFDCIVMDNVIEHLVPDSVQDVLTKCLGILNPTGYIIIWTPHRFSGPHDISKHFLPVGAKAEGFHLREFSFTEIEEELKEAGFRQVLGFPFHPRLLRKFQVVPTPALWAARKARFTEQHLEKSVLAKTLTRNRTLAHALVAILFPAVCVGVR
jgi:2-polyprenyl-3-methyl-5-hydroxy-6-metoxy-1,4-benzoquinol methylase